YLDDLPTALQLQEILFSESLGLKAEAIWKIVNENAEEWQNNSYRDFPEQFTESGTSLRQLAIRMCPESRLIGVRNVTDRVVTMVEWHLSDLARKKGVRGKKNTDHGPPSQYAERMESLSALLVVVFALGTGDEKELLDASHDLAEAAPSAEG